MYDSSNNISIFIWLDTEKYVGHDEKSVSDSDSVVGGTFKNYWRIFESVYVGL